MLNQFQILEEKRVFSSEKIKVIEAKVKLPNGNSPTWNIYENKDTYIGVPITKDNTVLLASQWRLGVKGTLTDFVGGAIDKNDANVERSLARELQEELGIIGGEYTQLFETAKGAHIRGINHIFKVEGFETGDQDLDENEFLEILELPITGLYQKLSTQYLCQAHTLLAAMIIEQEHS